MRVIECDECGETLQAPGELLVGRRLQAHLRDEHGIEDADAEALVADEGYEATDS